MPATKTPKAQKPVNFYLDPEFVDKIDDFRFRHRFGSRSRALRWLALWAIGQKPKPPESETFSGRRSGRGVLPGDGETV